MEQVPLTDHLTKNAGNGGFAESNKIEKKNIFCRKNCFVKRELSFFGSAPKISDQAFNL